MPKILAAAGAVLMFMLMVFSTIVLNSLRAENTRLKADKEGLTTTISTLTKENADLKERDRWCEIHTMDLPVIRARLDARQGNGYDYLEAFNEATKDIRPDRSGP